MLLVAAPPALEVLETAPLESGLDLREVRNALDVLLVLFDSAHSSIDIAQMYMLYYPPVSRGAALFSLYDALKAAAQRGVKVRILLDSTILEDNPAPTYSRMRDSLSRFPGIEVRACDLRPFSRYSECMMHAKYIVIDGSIAVIGSHNWSYSAFADNRELSLLVRNSGIARTLDRVFATDWLVAHRDSIAPHSPAPTVMPAGLTLVVTAPTRLRDSTLLSTADALRMVFARARTSLDIEVNSLTTRVDFGGAKRFALLDSLLRDAASRRVRVRLLVDRWAYECEPGLFRNLNRVDGIEVRVIDISELGPNPQTGTVHAKLVIADGSRALLGSATFSQRQLLECRNVGLLIEPSTQIPFETNRQIKQVVAQLQSVFEKDWRSPYCFAPR
jgi:phosphatidylserine/phosphatidylglycerophosphate/cardiolipin synthase-like enzyme